MKKIGEYLLAGAVVLIIAAGLYFILNMFSDKTPEVGTLTYKCGSQQIVPLGNEIYTTVDKVKTEKQRLSVKDIDDSLPVIDYNGDIVAVYDGKSENGDCYYTIYTQDSEEYIPKRAFFTDIEEPGVYIVCSETYWGNEKYNIGMEYFFKLNIE